MLLNCFRCSAVVCMFFNKHPLTRKKAQFECRKIVFQLPCSFQFAYKVTALNYLLSLEYSKFFIMPSVKISYTRVCSFVCHTSHHSVVLYYQISSLLLLLLLPSSSSSSSVSDYNQCPKVSLQRNCPQPSYSQELMNPECATPILSLCNIISRENGNIVRYA